eukprot:Filipodium_phascolosomae@DN2243_c0_g1_i1.p1
MADYEGLLEEIHKMDELMNHHIEGLNSPAFIERINRLRRQEDVGKGDLGEMFLEVSSANNPAAVACPVAAVGLDSSRSTTAAMDTSRSNGTISSSSSRFLAPLTTSRSRLANDGRRHSELNSVEEIIELGSGYTPTTSRTISSTRKSTLMMPPTAALLSFHTNTNLKTSTSTWLPPEDPVTSQFHQDIFKEVHLEEPHLHSAPEAGAIRVVTTTTDTE